jgi:hypothetical protein
MRFDQCIDSAWRCEDRSCHRSAPGLPHLLGTNLKFTAEARAYFAGPPLARACGQTFAVPLLHLNY